MQNKKQNKNKPKSAKNKRMVRFEELLEDDRFDDEDADSVTEDTLEFLSLDDDMIASYQKNNSIKSSKLSAASRSAKSFKPSTAGGSAKSSKASAAGGSAKSSKASAAGGSTKFSKASAAERSAKSSKVSLPGKKAKASRYARDYDVYEDEAYYEEDYEDEAYYKDDRYEDEEDYEDDRYEDEEDYEDDRYEDEEDYEDDRYEDEEDDEDDRYEDEEDYEDDCYEDEDDDEDGRYEDEEDYEDDDYEDEEDYEDDDYEDEEDYEDDDYEDEEDYEDDDYEDDDDYDDMEDGLIARFRDFLSEMSTLDMVVAMLGILVLAGAVITGGLYASARSTGKQVAAFAEVGGEIEGISVIGESGLLAVSESAKLGGMIDYDEEEADGEEEQEQEEEKEDSNKEIEVELRLTSIQSDLKIKFANKATGKLVGGVPFEVEVSGGGKTYDLKDDDKDGIIYQTGISAGSYSVTMKPLEGETYRKYKLQSSASKVEVTDKIAYKKVDVADEVKKESEINVAKEEASQQNTVVESALQNTVEWVESTKTPVGEEKDSYEEVSKDKIADPWAVASNYRKLVEGGSQVSVRSTDDPDHSDDPDDDDGDDTGGDGSGDGGTGDGNGSGNGGNGDGGGSGDGGNGNGGGSGDGNTGDGNGSGNGNTGDGNGSGDGNTGDGNGSGDGGNGNGSGSGDGNTGNNGGSGDGNTGNNGGSGSEEPPKKEEITVNLNKTKLELKAGSSETLSVSGGDSSKYSVKWSSSNTSVATVSESGGTVTAKAAGSATITAKVSASGDGVIIKNTELTCTVNVTPKDTPKKEVTLSLSESKLALNVAGSKTLKVTGSDGSSYSAVWSSSNVNIATVAADGTVTAKAAGSATITAEVSAGSDVIIKGPNKLTCSVTVTAQKNEAEVKLNKTELRLGINCKETLQIVDGSGKTYSGEWSSSDAAVAKVFQDGQVKGLKEGAATVNVKVKAPEGVTLKNPNLSCKVFISDKNYTKVTISGNKEVGIKQTLTLTAKSEPEGAEIVWSSEDEKKAKVDSKGVVTGVAEGKVKIKATCKVNESVYSVVEITVKKSVVDPAAKLKDKDGNQLYYKKKGTEEYVEATYQDYKEQTVFYKKVKVASEYKYTGWQTIDGYLYFFGKDNKYVTGEQIIQGAKYNFGSDGKLSKGSGSMGIDVSKHNGNIDWNAVKNSGVSYVIIRCGYRGYSTGVLVEDPMFRSNIKGAKAAGLKVGAYFFSQAVNEVEAVEEASMAIDLVKGYGLDYPLFLDVEGSGGRGDAIGKDTRTAVCKTFCQTVQNSGISSGIYANKTWFNEKISTGSLTNYRIWLAQYASTPTYSATRYDMWQYSSKGKVSGISGDVDMNISYMN